MYSTKTQRHLEIHSTLFIFIISSLSLSLSIFFFLFFPCKKSGCSVFVKIIGGAEFIFTNFRMFAFGFSAVYVMRARYLAQETTLIYRFLKMKHRFKFSPTRCLRRGIAYRFTRSFSNPDILSFCFSVISLKDVHGKRGYPIIMIIIWIYVFACYRFDSSFRGNGEHLKMPREILQPTKVVTNSREDSVCSRRFCHARNTLQ